jgi:hypothetical protein
LTPNVKLGNIVQIEGFPDDTLNAAYQIRRLRHVYTAREGFITELGFRGMGDGGSGFGP